jgi:hypothetical protein
MSNSKSSRSHSHAAAAAVANTTRTFVSMQQFSPSQHPWHTKFPRAQVEKHMINYVIPTEIFKKGAQGWSDTRESCAAAASIYISAFEILGQMLQFVPKYGTRGDNGSDYHVRLPDPRSPDILVAMPKVVFLMSLIVRKTTERKRNSTECEALPEHRLFASENQLCVLITVISLDPNLSLIDLIRAQVWQNAQSLPDNLQPFVAEDARRPAALDDGTDSGAEDEGYPLIDEEMDGEGPIDDLRRGEDEPMLPPVHSGRRSNGHRGGPSKRPNHKRTRPSKPDLAVPTTATLHNQIYTLSKAISVLTDSTFGTQAPPDEEDDEEEDSSVAPSPCSDQPMAASSSSSSCTTRPPPAKKHVRELICNRPIYGIRSLLDNAINNNSDKEVSLCESLSLQRVLESLRSKISAGAGSSPQLDWQQYYITESDGNEYFCVPNPELTWEFDPIRVTASSIADMQFPWATTPLRIMASIVATHWDIPIRVAAEGIHHQYVTNDAISAMWRGPSFARNVESTRAVPVATETLLQDSEVYQRIGIVPPSTKRINSTRSNITTRGRDAAPDPAMRNMLGTDTGDIILRSEVRGVGIFVEATLDFVQLLTSELIDANKLTDSRLVDVALGNTRERESSQSAPAPVNNLSRSRARMRNDEEDEEEEESRKRLRSPEDQEIDSNLSEDAKLLRRIVAERHSTITEIRNVAIKEYAAVVDPQSRIPSLLRSCAEMIQSGYHVDLDMMIHSSDMGPFSNQAIETCMDFKYLRIATNNLPIYTLRNLCHTVLMAPVTKTIAGHPYITGGFSGGKSFMWGIVEKISVKWHIEYIMGTSPKGALSIYADPNESPEDGGVLAFDELPAVLTQPTSRLSNSERDTSLILSSSMSSASRDTMYRTNQKIGERIYTTRVIMAASLGVAGSSNSPFGNNVPCARMVQIHLMPSLKDCTRNAVQFMTAQKAGDRSDKVVIRTLHCLDMLYSIATQAMLFHAIPAPNDELLLIHLTCAEEYLGRIRPDVLEKIRTLEVGQTVASTLQTHTSIGCVYSSNFGDMRHTPGTFSVESIANIVPYNTISYEVAFYIIAEAILAATNPLGYKMSRWLAESGSIRCYPFISMLKERVHAYSRGNRPATSMDPTVTHRRRLTPAATVVMEEELFCKESVAINPDEWCMRFGDFVFNTFPPLKVIQMRDDSVDRVNSKRGSGGSGRSTAPKHKTTRATTITVENIPIISGEVPPGTVEEYRILEGPTVAFPIGENTNAIRKTAVRTAMDNILGGSEAPEDYFRYKREPVGDELFINPNYISIQGSVDGLARLYEKKYPNSKLNLENIASELSGIFDGRRTIRAHLLPLVAQRDSQLRTIAVLSAIERHRAELWGDPRCVIENVPVAIPSQYGVDLLIEALLDSPMALVRRVLDYLCCEGTPTAKIALPAAHINKDAAHVLRTYDAIKVDGRVLHCSNPIYTLNAEKSVISHQLFNALSMRRHKEHTLTWDKNSEVTSIRNYFAENGIDAIPEEYTAEAIQARMSSRCPTATRETTSIVLAELKEFDLRVKRQQTIDDENFRTSRAVPSSAIHLTPLPPRTVISEPVATPAPKPQPARPAVQTVVV